MLSDSELGVTPGSPTVNMSSNIPLSSRSSQPNEHLVVDTRNSFIELRGAILDVGIFRDTLLPSLGLHTGLSLIAYGLGRATDKVEVKDWLWPSAQVINAWWSAVGRKVLTRGVPLSQALSSLSRPERLILTGVTLWGGRLYFRVMRRSLFRRDLDGKTRDDPRYDIVKKEDSFWSQAFFTHFLSEALLQMVITLPFVAPFRHQGGVFTGYHPLVQSVAVGIFATGFALETLADWQLSRFKHQARADNLSMKGVWSIVRHPNYLGNALVHFSFPLLLYSSDMLAPIEILGPIVNYLFLRHVTVYQQTVDSRVTSHEGEEKVSVRDPENDLEINAFWPSWKQVNNKWTWIVIGIGATGAAVEHVFHALHLD